MPTLKALADRDDLLVAVATGVPEIWRPFPVPSNTWAKDSCLRRAPSASGTPPHERRRGRALAMLAHDIPLVIAGGDLDKPEIASASHGPAGVNLKTGTSTPAQVAAAVDRVTSNPSYRDAAARVGAQLRSLGGAAEQPNCSSSSLNQRTSRPCDRRLTPTKKHTDQLPKPSRASIAHRDAYTGRLVVA